MPYLGNVPSSFNVGTDNINNDAITTAKIADGAILNADVNAAAAIAGTKISPDFGSQNILTTGTATAASLIPTSSTVPTNGLYLPAANSVAISTNGTGRLFVDASGNVGIGGSPTDALFVTGSVANFNVRSTSSSAATSFKWGNDLDTKSTEMWVNGSAVSTFGGASAFNVYQAAAAPILVSTNGSERLRITAAGLVGIGTSSPSEALTVSGKIQATTEFKSETGNDLRLNAGSVNRDIFMQVNGSTLMTVQGSTGRVGIGTSSPSSQLDVRGSAVDFDAARFLNTNASSSDATSSAIRLGITNSIGQRYARIQATEQDTNNNNVNLDFYTNSSSSSTGETIKMRIDGSGNVGIGTTSPTTALHVKGIVRAHRSDDANPRYIQLSFEGGTSSLDTVRNDGQTSAIIFRQSSDNGSTYSERARIDTSGRLLVGTSSSVYSSSLLTVKGGVSTSVGDFNLASTVANITSGNDIGAIRITNTNGWRGAQILATADGNWTEGSSQPTLLSFGTTASGASSPTERMRIDSSGYVTIYRNTSNLVRLNFEASSTRIEYSDSSGHLSFYTNSTARVRVNYSGGFTPVTDNSQSLGTSSERWTAVYAVNGTIQTSDLREKTDVATSSLGTDFIKQLRPVSYKFKVGENAVTKDEDGETDIITPRAGERTHWGFIAQEVKEVVDAAGVDFGGWILTDKDDPNSTQGLRYDQFIAPLTKALQETMAELEALKAEVATLKAQ